MNVLGHLNGSGILMIASDAKGEVTYDLTVFGDSSSKSASGSLHGEMETLFAVFSAGNAQLRLRDGHVIKIVLTKITGEDADFKVSGPVPGF
jgi:hypothetical protein